MAGIKDTTIKSKPRKRSFLGCFGLLWKTSESKQSLDVVKSSTSRKKNRFLSWSRFRMKKSAVKTVPVDTASPEKLHPVTEIVEISVAPDQTVKSKPRKKRLYENSQNIIFESRQSSDSNTCQEVITRGRKKEGKRKSISQQASPARGKISNNALSQSASASASASFPAIQVASIRKEKYHQEGGETSRKFETMIGMSIIMVTLVIMVVWGKLCAILCTSAWLYFVPRLRKSVKSSEVSVKNGDLKPEETQISSVQYKKKVVLEGLLRRSRRNVVGIL